VANPPWADSNQCANLVRRDSQRSLEKAECLVEFSPIVVDHSQSLQSAMTFRLFVKNAQEQTFRLVHVLLLEQADTLDIRCVDIVRIQAQRLVGGLLRSVAVPEIKLEHGQVADGIVGRIAFEPLLNDLTGFLRSFLLVQAKSEITQIIAYRETAIARRLKCTLSLTPITRTVKRDTEVVIEDWIAIAIIDELTQQCRGFLELLLRQPYFGQIAAGNRLVFLILKEFREPRGRFVELPRAMIKII
jgi:hypothetical protein